eukprot:gnl/MRDRNA2_/MRDRNA2_58993_c0_seq3.p1 gnl/MRDRNA2_/MRDRNA2_58993_c0~~gnl/MRDRNA2_/MRDRNA2_58993_c0_seq3.p1  ORF type:complete len:375 (-),score=56.81 gnl/MRDRNA2_/MRDRNA2_58993_c0_seq3:550-1674(-)
MLSLCGRTVAKQRCLELCHQSYFLSTQVWSIKKLENLISGVSIGPFSWQLWLSVVAVVVGYTFIVQSIRALDPQLDESPKFLFHPNSLIRVSYHMWVALLGGDDYEYTTGPGRLVRTGLLFFVMMVTATYTANLAAFFVAPAVKLHGPSDMESLRGSKACYTYEVWAPLIQPFVKELVTPPEDAVTSTEDRIQFCYDLLMKDEVDVFIEGQTILPKFALDNCDTTFLQNQIVFGEYYFSMFFPSAHPRGLELYRNLSAGLLEVTSKTAQTNRMKQYFGKGQACGGDGASELDELTADAMGGALVTSSAVAAAALLVAMCKRVHHKLRGGVAAETSDEVLETEGEMLKKILSDLDDLKKRFPQGVGEEQPLNLSV